jgi:hypothetical protein
MVSWQTARFQQAGELAALCYASRAEAVGGLLPVGWSRGNFSLYCPLDTACSIWHMGGCAIGCTTRLLRCVSRRRAEGPTSTRDQIAKANSWNATAKRQLAGSSTPARNAHAERSAWTRVLLMITLALRSRLRPRIGRNRAFNLPWSHSTRLLAYRSV